MKVFKSMLALFDQFGEGWRDVVVTQNRITFNFGNAHACDIRIDDDLEQFRDDVPAMADLCVVDKISESRNVGNEY